MKKLLFMALAALWLVGCSEQSEQTEQSNELTKVSLSFSPYEQSTMARTTRAASSIAGIVTHLDVWITDGTTTQDIHQTSSDAGFGTLSVTLNKTKTYTIYAIGHKADGATLSDGVISFTNDKVSHSMFYTTTFTPSETTSLSCLMQRIVSQFSFSTTDQVPDNVTKMTLTVNDVYDRWNVSTGATHSLNRTSTFENFSKKADGTVTFNIFSIVTDAQTTHDITVTAYDAQDNIVQQRTFTAVPLRNGYKTSYRGVYFTDTPTAANFIVNDWNEYEEVTF